MFAERIDQGIKYLNQYHPGWFRGIDLKSLDMSDTRKCVGGQLCGSYLFFYSAMRKNLKVVMDEEENIEADHGFELYGGERFDCHSDLTAEWSERIAALQDNRS